MNIQAASLNTFVRPVASSGTEVHAGETPEQFADEFRPTGAVATPAHLPRFSPEQSLESMVERFHQDWSVRVDAPRATVGIIVERGWKPDGNHDEVLNIADAILDAGGMPKLIFIGAGEARAQMAGLDGLAIPGGRDVDPSSYGAKMGPNMDPTEPDKAFDNFEIDCIRHAFETGMPLLGHCRGAQITNVAGGGTMTQDIPKEFETPEGWGSKYGTAVTHRPESTRHDYAERVRPAHFVVVEEGSRLAGKVGLLEAVNSIHHQCIAAVSPLLVPVCFALDGLVEGFERKAMPWQSGYQFHAEAMRYTDSRYQGLYENLVNDSAKFKAGSLFVPASSVQVGSEGDFKSQAGWLKSQARQRFGIDVNQMMASPVSQAHFEGLAEEWRMAHPA